MLHNTIAPGTLFQKNIVGELKKFRESHSVSADYLARRTNRDISFVYTASCAGDEVKLKEASKHVEVLELENLRTAIAHNHPRVIELLIKHSKQALGLNYFNIGGQLTTLAAEFGFSRVIIQLHELGLDFNQRNGTGHYPLHVAAYFGRYEAIRTLITYCRVSPNAMDRNHQTVLHHAAKTGQSDVIKTLIACTGITSPFVNLTDRAGRSALYYAVKYQHPELVKTFIELAADVNLRGGDKSDTVAHTAVQVEAIEILGILGEAKANFNLADTFGMTPAHYAADLNRATAIAVLHQYGANLNRIDSKRRAPINIAVAQSHHLVTCELLKFHVNVNIEDCYEERPAHTAIRFARYACLQALADAKADFTTPTGALSAPLQLALELDDYHSVCIMLASMPPEQWLSQAIFNKLQSSRTQLTDELVKKLANADDRSNIVTKLLRQEDKLGNILNTPTNTFLFFFTRNKVGDRKITGSMQRLVSEYGVSEENRNLIPTPPSP